MAVGFDASSESHTGTTGSANEASFSWTHAGGASPRGVVIFVINLDASTATATGVTYGGVDVPAVTGAVATDTAGEVGRCTAFFLGSGVPTGSQTVVVNRTNNANVLYAVCATVTAQSGWTTAVNEGGIVLLQNDGTLAVQSVSDGGAATASMRFAAGMSGLAAPPAAGTGSTLLQSIDLGAQGAAFCRETTAGTGARNVGFTSGTSDDRAFVHLAVYEIAPPTQTSVARVSLASLGGTPSVDTGHSIMARVRKQSGLGLVTLRAALYEGANNRSGDLESNGLPTSLTTVTLPIPEANAANITDYSNLEIRFWGYSSTSDTVVVELAEIWLETPEVTPGGTTTPQTLSCSLTLSPAPVRQPRPTRSASLALSPTLIRSPRRTVSTALSWVPALVKQARTARSANLALLPSIATRLTASRAYAATLGLSPSMQGTKVLLRNLAASLGLSPVLGRSVAVFRPTSVSLAPSHTRSASRTLSAVIAWVPALASTKVILRALSTVLSYSATTAKQARRTLTAPSTYSASVARQVSYARALVASVTWSPVISRATYRTVSATLTLAPTVAPIKVLLRALSTAFTLASTLVRQARPVRSAVVGVTATVTGRLNTARVLSASLSLSPAAVRIASRALSTALALSPTTVPLRVLLRTFSAAISYSSAVARQTRPVRVAAMDLVSSATRSVTRTLASALVWAPTQAKSRIVPRTLSASLSIAPTIARTRGQQLAVSLGLQPSTVRRVVAARAVDLALVPAVAKSFAQPVFQATVGYAAEVVGQFISQVFPWSQLPGWRSSESAGERAEYPGYREYIDP